MSATSDERLTQPARDAAKSVLRGVGLATSTWRPAPDFLVIGAKRGGTTSLFRYLGQHPGVLSPFPSPQRIKGVHHFTAGTLRSDAWYRSHFPTSGARWLAERRLGHPVVAGEASPYYLFHPLAPERVAATVPDVKLVALLRNPVDRAYSHWRERVRHGAEDLPFEEAIEWEPLRLRGEHDRILAGGYDSWPHQHLSYLDQGLYAPALRRWLEHFPREHLLIARSEDFFADPQRVYDRVTDHLGLPRRPLRRTPKYNHRPRADLDPGLRRELERRVAEHNRELEDLLGERLGWDSERAAA